MDEEEQYKQAIELWGLDLQFGMLSEECEVCGLEDKYYMTNVEIYKKTTTTAHCSNCGKVTNKIPINKKD